MKASRTLILLSLFSALVFVISGVGLLYLPYGGARPDHVKFTVKSGQSNSAIARNLEKKNLIASSTLFKIAVRLMGKTQALKSGQYKVEGNISIIGLIGILEKGKEVLISVTIPEGYRMTEIFALLKSKGYQNSGRYMKWATDKSFIDRLKIPVKVNMLEGILFPDTYNFPKGASEKLILKTMVANFKKRIPKDFKVKAQRAGLSYYQAITLASIVEKETGRAAERPTISSVFHNRMAIKMKLQTDPTVIYGIKNYAGRIRSKHLKMPHPYNTYVIRGLPPTPIASPGMMSLMAAVDPKKTKFLYFVARGDGTHEFTTNFKDHDKAVTKYQRRRKKDYRSY
ncbi:MAG: endolytic transglycosylase MltG [SAR324 cluster bacterium]|nr:endolytic transglycosylase MltG [SAR324 cluster bacterium]